MDRIEEGGAALGIAERLLDHMGLRLLRTDGEPLSEPGAARLPLSAPSGYGALYSAAYVACEQTKARSFGALPVAVYRKDGQRREEVAGHPLARLLAGQANDLMTGRDLRHWLRLRCDTMGDAYVYVEWRRGEPVALWPVCAPVGIDFDRTAPPGRRVRLSVKGDTRLGGSSAVMVPSGTYFAEEVLHFRSPITKDGVFGQSMAQLAAQDVGLSIDLERFYSALLENGNHHLGHVEIPEGRVTPEARDSIERAIEAKSGIGRAGKAPIFGYGAKWVTNQQTMRDASVIEQQQWVLEQVCRVCNVPPTKVYDYKGESYNSSESARIDYAADTVAPDAADAEAVFDAVLQAMGGEDLYLKFDLNGLQRGDMAARGKFYREMVYMGAMTRQEVRAKEELNPVDGLDKPLVPCNYGVLEPDGSVTVLSGDQPADGTQTGTTD